MCLVEKGDGKLPRHEPNDGANIPYISACLSVQTSMRNNVKCMMHDATLTPNASRTRSPTRPIPGTLRTGRSCMNLSIASRSGGI